MHALIDGILQYSRVGFANQNTSVINVGELIKSIIDDLNPPERISIQVDNMPTDFIVNKTQLQQIFQNLLDNAIKFIDKPQGHIQIRCEEKDSNYQFQIVDNGPGIEEKHFSQIFKMFQTIASGNQENEEKKGTGIGLALVKKIVETHNGKIWIESTPGLSTSFIFTLPKNRAYSGQ